jgi:hypothetical protein
MIDLTFKPKQVTKQLIATLPPRVQQVLTLRFGLGKNTAPSTLESIGKQYDITRERVRQIENYGIATIRKSDVFQTHQPVFEELEQHIDELGGIVPEAEFLEMVAKDISTRNHVHFLLVVGHMFEKSKENEEFAHRWHVNQEVADAVHEALRTLYANISDDDLIPEAEMISSFLKEVESLNERYKEEEIVKRWLSLSKKIGKNPLGEWGRAHSPNVRAKGMRDYAYLVIKRHGSPMHFREVAKAVTELFNRKAHEATCHNELIKDPRFVLVGRGLYALKEWGYSGGVVKDVIVEIVKRHGPLTRDDIIDHVRRERYVKDNTILVNLQDAEVFEKDVEGRYALRTEDAPVVKKK